MIDLEDGDPKIIEKFIDFLYTRQYDDGSGAVESLPRTGSQRKKHKGNTVANTSQATLGSNGALQINTALYIAGEKYEYVSGHSHSLLRVNGPGE